MKSQLLSSSAACSQRAVWLQVNLSLPYYLFALLDNGEKKRSCLSCKTVVKDGTDLTSSKLSAGLKLRSKISTEAFIKH